MTVQDVISRVQAIRQPGIGEMELLQIINDVEWEIERKIIHPRSATPEFTGYTDADMDTVLKAPRPFDNIYVIGCLREIDRRENQVTNFNNNEREYKEILGELAAWWVRNNRQCAPNVHSRWYGV